MLTDENAKNEFEYEIRSGWISVLLLLKAAVDFGVDMRNHDPKRTWDHTYCDN
jgi:hypothetical protein